MITTEDINKIRQKVTANQIKKGKITTDTIANIRQSMQQPAQQPAQQPEITPLQQSINHHAQVVANPVQQTAAIKKQITHDTHTQQAEKAQLENIAQKQKAGQKLTDEETKTLLLSKGMSEKEADYLIDLNNLSTKPRKIFTQRDTPGLSNKASGEITKKWTEQVSPETKYKQEYGAREATQELKKLDINDTPKYLEYKDKLNEAKANEDYRNIAKYNTLLKGYKKRYTNQDHEGPTINVINSRKNFETWEKTLSDDYNKFLNASNQAEKSVYAQQFQNHKRDYDIALKNYADALTYDELINNNIVEDSAKSFGKNVLGGMANIINGGYTAGGTLSGLDATTINAEALWQYNSGLNNNYQDNINAISKLISPGAGSISNATGAFEGPGSAFSHLEALRALNPYNTRLNNLYNQISTRTYKGTKEDLANELDAIQKEIYQNFKDVYTQDELDAVADQLRHNEIYGDYAAIPNAFGTTGNMVPSILIGTATGGLGEALGGGSMATAGTIANTAQQVGSLGSLGLGAYSQGMDEALQNGATWNQAQAYGTLTGATEVGTEMLGGESVNRFLGKTGKSALGKAFGKAIDNLNIESKVGRIVANTLSDVAGESTEEMISEALNPLWKAITYDPNALPQNADEMNEYFKNILKAGADAIPSTLLMQGAGVAGNVVKTQQVENGIIKSINESDLSQIVKNQLINEVRKASTDVKLGLEGQEDAKAYLGDVAREKYANLSAQSEQMKQRIPEGYSLPQSTIDILAYTENNRPGLNIAFDTNIQGNGTFVENPDGTRTITLNPNSKRAVEFTLTHELGHDLKGTGEYTQLQNLLTDYAKGKPGYENALNQLDKTYKESGANYNLQDEATNDMLGQAIGEQEFYNKLAENPTLFNRVTNGLKNLLGNKESKLKNKIEKLTSNALKQEYRGKQEGTQQSLSENNIETYSTGATQDEVMMQKVIRDSKGNVAAKVDYNIYNGKPYVQMIETNEGYKRQGYATKLMQDLQKEYPGVEIDLGYTTNDGTAFFDKITEKVANPGYSKWKKSRINNLEKQAEQLQKEYEAYYDKLRPYAQKYDKGIITEEEHQKWSKLSHEQLEIKDKLDDVNEKLYQISQNIKGDELKEYYSYIKQPSKEAPTMDNQGRELSKGQQTYFENEAPQGLDENGNLQRFYHGTPNGDFTIFKDGTYLTKNKAYADRYQSTSASSLANSGKVASNPKTFEVYAKIKNCFDLSNPEAKKIYIDEYIKGARALGISPYESEDFYNNLDVIDWTEGEDLREFLQEFHPEYDSILLYEGGDIGYDGESYFGKMEDRGDSLLVFNPNQIKSIDNLNPTDNPDINLSKTNQSWQQFLDKNLNLAKGTKTNFEGLPSNEELQRTERESVANEPIVAENLRKTTKNEPNKISENKPLNELRSWSKVGDRKTNAYQYDNPEVKPFFQYEAKQLLTDLENALPAERYMREDGSWDGMKRSAVDDIATLLDSRYGYSYADIRKGLEAIINDEGSENNALSKRIEMLIDNRLRKGYTDYGGYFHDPSENYKKFLNGEEYVSPEQYDNEYLQKTYGTLEDTDNTAFSLSEDESKEVIDYLQKLQNDTTIDEDYKEQVLKKFDNLNNYRQFEDIKQEVSDYKDKMYKGISGLVDIANSTEEDVKQRPMEYKQRVDKNTANQRKFFENIETSNIIADETKNRVNATTYEVKHNLDTMQKMSQKLDTEGNKLVEDWKTKSVKRFTDEDVALGSILLERYQQNKDFESAARTAEKLADAATESARALQMYSIWQRLSPETMQIFTQKQLNKAFEEMKQKQTGKWIEANKDKFKLTAEDSQFIYEQVEKAQQAIDEETKQRELSKIENMINNKLPPKSGDALKAFRRLAMLGNPKTQVRNFTGNSLIIPVNDVADVIGTVIDKVVSLKTGKRTTSTPNLVAKGKGFVKGIRDAVKDYKTGTRTTQTGSKYEFEFGAKPFNENTGNKVRDAVNTKLNGLNNLLSAIMSGGDRPFYEAAYNNSLQGQMKANNVTEPTQDMIDIAVNEALQRTWNDNNEYTKTVLGIRRAMNKINIKGFGLGDLIIPFAKTPANLTKAMVEYSPAGFIPAILDYTDMSRAISRGEMTAQQQKRFVSSMSKAIAGTMLYAIAGSLARSGRITGSGDDDKDVKNFEQNVLGIQPYSVRIGDKTYTYSWANPLNAPLAIMADTHKLNEENASTFDKLYNGIKVAGNILLDNSFLQGLSEVFTNQDGVVAGLVDAVTSMPDSMIPTFISQIASLGDDTQRQTYEYKNKGQTVVNKIKNKIPGARQTLEPKLNTFGEEIENQNSVFNAFINPANVREARITDTQKALYDLYEETKNKNILPDVAPNSTNTSTGEKMDLTNKDKVTYQKTYGDYVTQVYEGLFNENAFDTYHTTANNNEGKVKILRKVKEDANLKSREAIGAISSSTNSDLSKLNEKLETLDKAGIPLDTYYLMWYAVNNGENKKNNTKRDGISETRRNLNEDITNEQKKVLYEIFDIK